MRNLVLTLALASLLCACDTVNMVEPANPASQREMLSDKRIITDSSLNDIAYVAGVNTARNSAGLLKVQAELVNKTTAYRNVNYKFEWIDKSGMQVSAPTSTWISLPIEGGESRFVSAVAPNKNVVDFRLKLMPNVRD